MMKVLVLNGSPRENGNTEIALAEMQKIFDAEGVEVETIRVGKEAVRGCTGCRFCWKNGKCVRFLPTRRLLLT